MPGALINIVIPSMWITPRNDPMGHGSVCRSIIKWFENHWESIWASQRNAKPAQDAQVPTLIHKEKHTKTHKAKRGYQLCAKFWIPSLSPQHGKHIAITMWGPKERPLFDYKPCQTTSKIIQKIFQLCWSLRNMKSMKNMEVNRHICPNTSHGPRFAGDGRRDLINSQNPGLVAIANINCPTVLFVNSRSF